MKTRSIIRRVSLTALILTLLISATSAFASDATDVMALVNEHRTANGLGPVCLDPLLNEAARAHSQDMLNNSYFDHTGLNGSKPWDRIQATGYDGSYYSENIAFGYGTAAEVFEGWRTSPGHNTNMLSASATEMGIARVGDYWTQVFSNGEPCGDGAVGGGKDPVVTTAQPVHSTPEPVVEQPAPQPVQPDQPIAPTQPEQPIVEEEIVWVEEESHAEAGWSWQEIPAGYTCTTETWGDEYGVTWEYTTCWSN
jgi:hypothetical protein